MCNRSNGDLRLVQFFSFFYFSFLVFFLTDKVSLCNCRRSLSTKVSLFRLIFQQVSFWLNSQMWWMHFLFPLIGICCG
jgi:hypothetical protein